MNLIKSLINLGIEDSYSVFDKTTIRTANIYCLISFPAFLFFIILDFFTIKLVLTYSTMLLLNSLTLFLNYYKKHHAASYYIVYILLIQYCYLHVIFGPALGIEPLFILQAFASVYLFYSKKEIYLIVTSIVLSYFLVKFITFNYMPPSTLHVFEITPYIFFFITIVVMTYLATTKFREIMKYANSRNTAVQELQIINQSLVKNEKLILEQKDELQVINKQLERYAFIASHDLKSPIRSIKSFLDLSKIKLEQGDLNKVKEYYSFMSKSATHMNNLINDLLEYSKLEDQTILFELTDLNELLESAIEILQAEPYVTYDKLPLAVVNPIQFQLVFQNLIQNGLKYNESKEPKVTVRYHQKDKNHLLSFSDNGIGIEHKYREEIFEMFSRLHTASDYDGTGLGLSICHKIIKQHKGKIILKNSSCGLGSTFVMSWPVDKQKVKNQKHPSRSLVLND